MMIRRVATLLAAAALLVTSGAIAQADPSRDATSHHHQERTHHHHTGRLPDRIELPDGFLPEGITIRGPFAYLGSRADGSIYRANLVDGKGEVIGEGPGTPAVGLKIDQRGRLFVSGGGGGDARVVDSRTGTILRTYDLTDEPSFVNDVILTRRSAWFTDSQRPVLYRLPLGPRGAMPAEAVEVPLTGDWVQGTGFGANGIEVTPDGRALLVVNTTTGFLYRVDPATGEATRVDLDDTLLVNGDGLLVRGRTLYVVLNQDDTVAVIRLDRRGTRGALVDSLTSGDLDVPTTVAAFARGLYLPNARFGEPQEPDTEFWITRIEP